MPRILALLAEHGIPGTFFVPGYTAEHHDGLISSIVAAGHEIGHHGYIHLRSDKISADEQRDEIEQGFAALAAAGAPRPVGYRSPAWELTAETFDLLVEHGFAYDSSCMGDDRPYLESWARGSILELPVHWSLDDWPRFGWSIDHGGNVAHPDELLASWPDEYGSARADGRHVTFTMHPEVIGRAYRFAAPARARRADARRRRRLVRAPRPGRRARRAGGGGAPLVPQRFSPFRGPAPRRAHPSPSGDGRGCRARR